MNEERPSSTPGASTAPLTDSGTKPAVPAEPATQTRTPEDHAATVDWSTSPPPKPELPGFEVLELLGRGGMGVVYKARWVALQRIVAVKVLIGGAHASSVVQERFLREARAMAGLDHPHAVRLHSVGPSGDSLYMVMEYCEGETLADRIARGPFAPAEAAGLVEKIAGAIQAAHERGMIHRDVKPQNVLFTADGTPKLTDFGLAKNLTAEQHLTATGDVIGTPGYMAPEQASGQGKHTGPGTDVYGLGAILFAALTGRAPFQADSRVATLLQVVTQEPEPPSRLRADVPAALETICLKCLAKRPEDRYPSAKALGEDLQRFLRGEVITAPAPVADRPPPLPDTSVVTHTPTTTPPTPGRPRSRRKKLFIAAAVLLPTAIGLLVIFWPRSPDPDKVYGAWIQAGIDLARAYNDAVPEEKLQQAKDQYNATAVRWKELDIPYEVRQAVEKRHEKDLSRMADMLSNAFPGRNQLREATKMLGGSGKILGDMMSDLLKGMGGKDMPKLPFPSFDQFPSFPAAGPPRKDQP
jgi:serine/threonine protein kinase